MPLLAQFLSGVFGWLFTFLAKRLTVGFAAAAAYLSVTAIAYAAVTASLTALVHTISLAIPQPVVMAFGAFFPTNSKECVTVIIMADATMTAWEFWSARISVAFKLSGLSNL